MMKAKKYCDLYTDELSQVVHPDTAVRIVSSELNIAGAKIFGLKNFLSPFCNGDMGKNKLLQDISSGNVVILEDGKAFHGILDSNGMESSFLNSSFRSKIQHVRTQGKVRPKYGFGLADESENVVAEYSPEPVVPDTVNCEENPRTEFCLGWMLVENGQQKEEILKELLPAKEQADKRAFLTKHNEHLDDYVRKGEIVVIPTTDPVVQEDVNKLKEVKVEATAAHRGIHSLPEETSDALNNHFYGFDHSAANKKESEGTLSDSAGKIQTWGGALNNRVDNVFKELQNSIDTLDSAYKKAAPEIVESKKLPESLKMVRAETFQKLQRPLDKLALKASGIKVYPKVKHTLGLSTKSIIHNADALLESGEVRSLGRRTEVIAKSAKKVKVSGRTFLYLDIALSAPKVYTAATTEGGDVGRVVTAEAARVTGGYYVGLGFEIAAASALTALGVSSSIVTVPLLLVAGGVGATYGSGWSHDLAEVVYDGELGRLWDNVFE
ncbi:hypothetical protein [Halodesulfovibrio sp. MK-HDV]|uniref:hypothetical protein n=1 Tax=unclassified Halodesulfovibrio TaxID=2644657 RepID=UPI00137080FD|nr:hypothetical protein [Halodesulfovibrio sp. MK-HDV]KAF1076118.1 hypothetical protein MKHDV_01557 [Halodesulfovibrio sp. MK-HDV]